MGGSVSNSITSPDASSSAARSRAPSIISRYCRRISGMVVLSTNMGGSVKFSSG